MNENVLTMHIGKAPEGLASDLRKIADQVDAGEIKEMCAIFVEGNFYNYLWATSLEKAVAFSTLLQAQAIHRMRETE